MKNLFNLKLVVLLLSFGFFATSCDKDDDDNNNGNPSPNTNTEYNGEKFSIKNGYYVDGGALSLFGNSDTHYFDYFFLTDGTPQFAADGEITSMPDGKIAIFTALISAGGNQFNPGTFTYTDLTADVNLTEAQVKAKYNNKSFFYHPFVRIDTDGDHDWEEEVDVEVTGGTIKVTDNIPNITMEYNLTLANGKTLKGKYAGKFNKLEVDIEDEDNEDLTLNPGTSRKHPVKWLN